MAEIPLVISYDGRWHDNRYVDNKILGVLVNENTTFLCLLEVLYRELHLDIHKQHLHLFVNMQLEATENSVMEIKSDGAVKWYFSIVKEDKKMNFPLIITTDARPMFELIEKSMRSSNDFFRCDFLGTQVTFEHGSCSHNINESSSSASSCITSKSESTSTMLEFVDAEKVDDLKESYLFSDKKEVKKALHLIAIRKNFQFKTKKSDDSRLVVQCLDAKCNWYMRASKYKGGDLWVIRKYVNEHTCSLDVVVGDHRQATSSMISKIIKGHLNLGVKGCVDPNAIIDHMRLRHGVNISYAKARRAKEYALDSIRGSPEESYALLPSYLFMLKTTNPGSVTAFELDDQERFKYLFFSLGASIQGWSYCRPVICVDGTFLKCKFGGTLLIASAIDGNNQIFPLAFGISDSENNASWEWFFEKLKGAIGVREDLVFVSDRHKSIEKAILKVFPDSFHGVCTYHLLNNLKSDYKFFGNDMLFNQCARAYLKSDFEYFMSKIEDIQPNVAIYLRGVKLERWARPYFVKRRFNIMTSNISESMNSALRHARELPITAMLEEIRLMLQSWFYTRSMAAAGTFFELTEWAEEALREQRNLARTMKVNAIGFHVHQVIDNFAEFVVDMANKTCTCQKWNLELIPCAHACVVISTSNLSFYTYVSSFYLKSTLVSTYSGVVNPVGNKNNWNILDEVKEATVLPPEQKTKGGRPKKQRFRSAGEFKKTVRCGRCGRMGHNRKTCKFLVPVTLCNVKKKKLCHGAH